MAEIRDCTELGRAQIIIMEDVHKSTQQGYVAIATVLVITVVVLVVGLSVALLSVSDIQMSLAARKGDASRGLAESCIENALLELNETATISTPVTTPDGTCTITVNSQTGSTWTFTTTATREGYTTEIQVVVVRSNTLTITSWQEI